MNEKEILIAFLATTLNMATESVSDMLYKKSAEGEPTDEIEDGALDKLKALDQARVTKLKPDTKQFFDNGYKKAQSEVSAAWEKKIRDGFGIEDDVTGEDLIAAAKERTGKAKMGDDQVKLHPLYLSLEKAAKAEKEAAIQEAQKQLEDYKASVEKGAMVSKVQARAKEFLMNLKPVRSILK